MGLKDGEGGRRETRRNKIGKTISKERGREGGREGGRARYPTYLLVPDGV